jgi:hypothetical protein
MDRREFIRAGLASLLTCPYALGSSMVIVLPLTPRVRLTKACYGLTSIEREECSNDRH